MRVFPVGWPGPGRLAVVTRPNADDLAAEMAELAEAGYDTLVSLLSGPEAVELGLRQEREVAVAAGLRFEWHPVRDFGLPGGQCFRDALAELHAHYRSGGAIAAHCRGSIGRSPLLIASLLVLDGAPPREAWRRLADARGMPVPDTAEQRQWIESLAGNPATEVERDEA